MIEQAGSEEGETMWAPFGEARGLRKRRFARRVPSCMVMSLMRLASTAVQRLRLADVLLRRALPIVAGLLVLTAPALAEADPMVEAAVRAGRMLSVFQNRRWDWDYLTVKKVIEDRLIGQPYL